MIYITEVRMEPPGSDHGHVAAVRWVRKDSPEGGETSRVEMIEWLGDRTDVAFVREPDGTEVPVRAFFPNDRRAFIACFHEPPGEKGKATNVLLTLPRYGVKP
jgi:hypothetical protein